MIFNASMDKITKITTSAVGGIFFIILYYVYIEGQNSDLTAVYVLGGVFAAILLVCFIFSPRAYEIYEEQIIIKRIIADVHFDLSDITEIKSIQKLSEMSSVRVFAVGGLFGHFGLFWNYANGRMTFYASNNAAAIMFVTDANKKIVITPDNCDAFLEQFLKNKKKEINT